MKVIGFIFQDNPYKNGTCKGQDRQCFFKSCLCENISDRVKYKQDKKSPKYDVYLPYAEKPFNKSAFHEQYKA